MHRKTCMIIKTDYEEMKKDYLLLLLLIGFLFLSCSNVDEMKTNGKRYTVRLELEKDFDLRPFPSTRSIPQDRPGTPLPEEESISSFLFSRIEYVVYDKESGALVKSKSFTETNSDDFGKYIYDELEAGTYTLVLLAHGTTAVEQSGNEIRFSEVTDSFYAIKEVEVSPNSENLSVAMLLKRVVGRIEFAETKPAPENAAEFIIQIDEQYNALNLKTGVATQPRTVKKEYRLLRGEEAGNAALYHFYTFLPEPAQGDTVFLSEVKLITLDARADTLHTVRLTSVPVVKNRITRYTGSLYAPPVFNNAFKLEIEDYGHWADTIHVPF